MEFLEVLDGTSEEIITLMYLFIGPRTYCDRGLRTLRMHGIVYSERKKRKKRWEGKSKCSYRLVNSWSEAEATGNQYYSKKCQRSEKEKVDELCNFTGNLGIALSLKTSTFTRDKNILLWFVVNGSTSKTVKLHRWSSFKPV